MSTVTITEGQTGRVEVSGPTPYDWEEGALPQTQTKFYEVGITFDFGFSTSGDLLLAPSLPFTRPADALRGSAAEPWTLRLETSLTNPVTVLNLYMVLNPQPWTTANSPYTCRAGNLADESVKIEQISNTSDAWELNANGSTYDLVWEFDFDTSAREAGWYGSYTLDYISPDIHPFRDLISDSSWNGTLQFHIFAGGAVSCAINAASLTGEVQEFHTGFMNEDINKRSRAVHCYITGQPYMSHEAIEDGWRDGIMVHPDNSDPADPLDTDYFTPPPGEGVVDDEIPDVE